MRTRTPSGSATGSRPKTRTDPLAAFSKPRTWRISVVLPAPLTPTRPKTTPRGTVRLTSSRATLAPKRRVNPRISITLSARLEPLAYMDSFLLGMGMQALVALTKERDDLFDVDVHLVRLGQQGIDALGQDLQPFTPGQRRARVGDIRPRGPTFDDNAFLFQLAISPGNGVGIDRQLLGEHTDGRQLLARRQAAGRHLVFHLIDDLQVDRHAIVRGDVEVHRNPPP